MKIANTKPPRAKRRTKGTREQIQNRAQRAAVERMMRKALKVLAPP